VAIIIGNLGRLFNNPQMFHRLEDRLAESAPVKQLARVIVNLFQRGSWEIKQLKEGAQFKELDSEKLRRTEEELARRFKTLTDEWARRSKK